MLYSFKARIVLLIFLILVVVAVLTFSLTHWNVQQSMLTAERQGVANVLRLVELNIQTGYRGLLHRRMDAVQAHKNILRAVSIGIRDGLNEIFEEAHQAGHGHEDTVRRALAWLDSRDPGQGVKFVVIDAQGRIVSDSHAGMVGIGMQFVRDMRGLSLLESIRLTIDRTGEAFSTFHWPWTDQNLSAKYFGYFHPFLPMNWTIGVFMGLGELEQEGERQQQELLDNLRASFDDVRILDTGYLFLFNEQGQVLIKPGDVALDLAGMANAAGGGLLVEDLRDLAESRKKQSIRVLVEDEFGRRREVEAFCGLFRSLGWYVAIMVPVEEMSKPARAMSGRLGMGMFWVLLGSLALGLLITTRMTKPLDALADHAKSLPHRDFTSPEEQPSAIAHLAHRQKGEVARLADALVYLERTLRREVCSLVEFTAKNERLAGELAERQRTEHVLRQSRERAEAANMAKSRFLANMSHEIRTPLNAVLGFAHVLERENSLTPQQHEHVRRILRGGEHLLLLINDILDMSRIEIGQVVLHPEDFGLHSLFLDLEHMFQSAAAGKGLDLTFKLDQNLPRIVHGDQARLRQVLMNLIGNAVKFTQTGGVVLRAWCAPIPGKADADQGRFRLVAEVEDTGPGIAAQDQERLFDAFFQTAKGLDADGTGLGLSISRELARLMNGDLTVTSTVGRGSCFKLEVILQEAQGRGGPGEERQKIVGLAPGSGPWRILAVDDKPDNLAVLTSLLRPVGFEVREASSGEQALAMFPEWTPHAVLLDIRMPGMDGYETARRIRAADGGKNTLIVAVTAGVFEDSRQDILAAGVNAYLAKPFAAEELFDVLGDKLGVRYLYGEQNRVPGGGHESLCWAGEPRQGRPNLSETTMQAILRACAAGDIVHLRELSGLAAMEDERAAQRLRLLAENFDYQAIIRWLGVP